jgi:hypothetical protein
MLALLYGTALDNPIPTTEWRVTLVEALAARCPRSGLD